MLFQPDVAAEFNNHFSSSQIDIFHRILLERIRKIIFDVCSNKGDILLSGIIPSLVMNLSFSTFHSSEYLMEILHILFASFFRIENIDRKDFLLQFLLTACCSLLSRYTSESYPFILCSQGLMHIAKSSPDQFRSQAGLLSEESRACLQSAMKSVMQLTNAPQLYSIKNGSTVSSLDIRTSKTINLARYKKV